jgi:hypothetical protein
LLHPGGVVFVAVPNARAILIEIYQAKSSFLGLPEHIIHFTRQGLATLLRRAGFAVKIHRYVSRIPYYALSNRVHLRGFPRKLLNYGVRLGQWVPLQIANRCGRGLYQQVWAVPLP